MTREGAVLALGLTAQAIYAARMIWQWLASERSRRVVVPRAFWYLSLAAAGFAAAYGLLAPQPVYLVAILPGAFIAVRNLLVRRPARRRQLVPVAAALAVVLVWVTLAEPRAGGPVLAALGYTGSLVYTSRFVVQWWASERKGRSAMPPAFWILSLAGALMLFAYGVARADPVMIVGFSLSPIPYLRNLWLGATARARGRQNVSATPAR